MLLAERRFNKGQAIQKGKRKGAIVESESEYEKGVSNKRHQGKMLRLERSNRGNMTCTFKRLCNNDWNTASKDSMNILSTTVVSH